MWLELFEETPMIGFSHRTPSRLETKGELADACNTHCFIADSVSQSSNKGSHQEKGEWRAEIFH
jgi:hypothetical protein